MKIANDIIDDIIKKEMHTKIAKEVGMYYSITNYAIECDDKLLCFTGSDITDAANIKYCLEKEYPDKMFKITDEFMSFEL